MPRHIYSTVPLWQIVDNGVLRPAEAKSYLLDESMRPHPPIGWRSLHFGKLDKPVTMREVLADYQFFDANKDYSLSYGNPGNEVKKAQSKQYNATAWNDQILNPSLANINVFSGRPTEIFNSEETAGLSGDVPTVLVTIKNMVAKIQSLKLPEIDTTKLINDVYDKYLAPLINKFPSLKDPDTGADIKDISYLLTLAPPLTNANPTVVPVQINKTAFTGSPPPVPAFPAGAPTTTLAPTHIGMSSGLTPTAVRVPPPLPTSAPPARMIRQPIFSTPVNVPSAPPMTTVAAPRIIREAPSSAPTATASPESMMDRLARQLRERRTQIEPSPEPQVIQQQHDIAKSIREKAEPSGVEGKKQAEVTRQDLVKQVIKMGMDKAEATRLNDAKLLAIVKRGTLPKKRTPK